MEKDCTYYWNKIAITHFANLDHYDKMQMAREHLSKDELIHLKRLLEE